ncbi:hypothetical protein Q9L58_004072 [Maublancomyces gigas]|uniref:Uncharacterized protein n=1 Tax=Discina gigas TaxID=1032678 RepID=A0ABR3GM15_9PEZI
MVAAAETSTVTRLRFSYAEMSSWALQYILRVPIALSHFSYSPVDDIDIDLPQLMSAMAPLRPSVQYLHLDFCNVELMTIDEVDKFILPYDEGSLRSWSMLRTLSCSLMPLLGNGQRDGSPRLMNVLPAGIRELEILEDCIWSIPEKVDQIVEMLAQKDWVVPCLEKLAVVLKLVKCQRATDELTIACEAAGVSFVEDSFVW